MGVWSKEGLSYGAFVLHLDEKLIREKYYFVSVICSFVKD